MTAQQEEVMKYDRLRFMEWERESGVIRGFVPNTHNVARDMWLFEAGWCVARGIPVRMTPKWDKQLSIERHA